MSTHFATRSLGTIALGTLSFFTLFGVAPTSIATAQQVPEAIVVAQSPTYTWNGVTVSRAG